MKSGETHNIFPDYEVGAYRVSNTGIPDVRGYLA